MHQPDQRKTLYLLIKVFNNSITDFYYFPEVVFAGRHRIEKEDFDYILAEGFITKFKHDVFGRYYALSEKGINYLYKNIVLQKPRRKRPAPPVEKGLLYLIG